MNLLIAAPMVLEHSQPSFGGTVKSIVDDALRSALDITGGPRIPLTPILQNDYVGGDRR